MALEAIGLSHAPLSAALDSLGPDAPHATFGAYTGSVQRDQDNDDFGGFTDAPTTMSAKHETDHAAYPLSAHANDQQDGDQFGELADVPKDHVDSVVLDPLSAALDALAPVQDAPLPVLGAYTASVPEEQGDDDDDDGFGVRSRR
jgi:hypothetical protein